MAARSRPRISRVRTTPFTCGAHASVTIRSLSGRLPSGAGASGRTADCTVMKGCLGGDSADLASRLREKAGLAAVAESWPAENLQCSAGIFDKGSAAFNPVAVVEVKDSFNRLDGCVMNMTAHDAVEAAGARLPCHGALEAADVLDRILHLLLQIRG